MPLSEKQRALLNRKLHWLSMGGDLTEEETTKLKATEFSMRDASEIISCLFTAEAANPLREAEKYEKEAALQMIRKILSEYP